MMRPMSGDLKGVAAALDVLGDVWLERGELNKGEDFYRRSFALRKTLDSKADLAMSLWNLGHVLGHRGESDQIAEYFRQSLALAEEVGDKRMMIASLRMLAGHHQSKGDLAHAEKLYAKISQLEEDDDSQVGLGHTLHGLGYLAFQKGDLDRAEDLTRRALDLLEKSSPAWSRGYVRLQLVEILLARNKTEDAAPFVNQLENMAQQFPGPDLEIALLLAKAQLQLKRLQLATALEYALQAKTRASEMPHLNLQNDATRLAIQTLLQMFLITKEVQYKTQITALLLELEYLGKEYHLSAVLIESMLLQGMLQRGAYELRAAREHFEAAQRQAEEHGLKMLEQQATHELHQLQDQLQVLRQLHETSPQAYEQAHMSEMLSYLQGIHRYLRKDDR
ncbi:MAG: tetratricopeptide repeat protein [Candidatus Heimdallarchaeota archaeon]